MTPARKSRSRSGSRRWGICLALGACWSIASGCARMQDLRQPGGWPIGRRPDLARQARVDDRSPTYDPFSGKVVQADPPPDPGRTSPGPGSRNQSALAQVSSAGSDEPIALPRAGGSGPLTVSLEEPRPLPPRGRTATAPPETPATAARSASGSGSTSTSRVSRARPASDAETMAGVVAAARARLDGLTAYQVHLEGQERIGDALQAPEAAVLSIRRQPRAVRLEWPDGPNQGREVLYLADTSGGLMHVKMPNPILPRITMRPDSPMALRNSRHPITEAGFDTIVGNLERTIALARSGETSLTFQGVQVAPGDDRPLQMLREVRADGEIWLVGIDPETRLPAYVQATDAAGQLLERYRFLDFQAEPFALASADAFDPDARWGQSKGLFHRLARSPGPDGDRTSESNPNR